MKDFIDRIPSSPGRRKITHDDGTSEYVTMELADLPTAVGTPLNRVAFMALQGFEEVEVIFNQDGSISEVSTDGLLKTTFNSDGSITEKFTSESGKEITKTTSFLTNGNIKEVLS